ncbi:3-phosphoshikimate 1-carboxyvinyltransferase [sulfur-oxidizing endosymbiont of Gigantopelta aegis]|uniref:3-phosphoshikimate 1-carboxyvinyltransferase n=1 Tax=sulfur-oxidizing endosymbiont of Gigantopelta aegis TaxID=2794934 RepID=UPI0018DB0474|nr:3-phosphoshikimate 1-carboxyvinyltransferase [sulfur-oxidizing endosymbiont of Gigantopelta aegis]
MSVEQRITYTAQAGGCLTGQVRVPGDKSISHRSIMLGSLSEGTMKISGFLQGEDSLATLKAFRAMGVNITGPDKFGNVVIEGVGMHGLKAPAAPLDLGNSGTSMRLLTGLLAAQGFDLTLAGDESLSTRPMKRVTDPVIQMGANIEPNTNGTAPLTIKSDNNTQLNGIDYTLPMASAQVKSCVLLAGLYAQGETCVTEPAPTRDHTERMLQGFGYTLEVQNIDEQRRKICLQGGGKLIACDIDVPSDISSTAFFIVGASIAKGSDITLQHVGINPTRIGVINILKAMGADITLSNEQEVGGEPVADICVRYARLKGIHIPEDQVPLAIDEFPAIAIAAACADGQTILTGAEELRVKESDRIQAMVDGLQILGIDCQGTDDGMIINGGTMSSGTVDSLGDHRIAMSFAMAALAAQGTITIKDCANVNTSFPDFIALAQKTGLNVSSSSDSSDDKASS